MHRLPCKPPTPDCLQDFRRANPQCRDWNSFYGNYSASYKTLKGIIAANQEYLCAYCEEKLPNDDLSQMRIEHFHPKEDVSTVHNWAFDWNNMLVTSHGGSRNCSPRWTTELHCDASKEQHVTPTSCEGYLLHPLTMPVECLFTLDQITGELLPDESVCNQVSIPVNHYSSVSELVQETIRILNLNCDRLKQNRLKVIQEFERIRQSRKRNPKMNQSSIRRAIAQQWFGHSLPSFYTTRRILLGKYADEFIIRS